MLLEKLLPRLPETTVEILIYLVALAGAVLITYAVWLEAERRQDLIMFLGAGCLFVYALFLGNVIFALAMAGLGLASLVEFIEIYLGLHKHSPDDLQRYKKLR